MADYAEVLLEAMDIISKKQIDAVSFDKTIEATIINTSKAADGIYTVAYGNSKFTAYSTETAYRENDVVMVTVPQGNFDNQKIIIGKKVDDMNTPLVYKSPFQQIINVTNNLIEEDVGIFGCWANGGTTLGLENDPGWNLDVLDFKDSNAHTKPQATQQNPDPKYYGLIWDSGDIFETQFTRLGLQAQFCTWLSEYNTTFGNYGLALKLTFKCVDIPDPPTANDPPNTFYKIVTFDSNGFFGDVYNFETYYTQETVFDLTEFTNYPIVNIQLFGYQRNNFFNADGEDIYQNEAFTPDFTGGFMTINPNIFIKDPYICLGIAAEDFITDTATLITPNALTYQKYYDESHNDAWLYDQNAKRIQLRWIHKFEKEDVIKAVEDNEFPSNYEVRWYRYKLGAKSPDQFAGAHWTRFYGIKGSAPSKKTGEWVITEDDIAANPEADLATDKIFIDFEPNINWQEEELKAIVLKIESSVGGHNVYRLVAVSNTITFTNDDNVRSQATIIDANALAIVYDDDEKGHYFLYNRAGNLHKNEDKERVRILRAVFDRDVPNIYEKADLNVEDCYSVIWTFPSTTAKTMIIPMDCSSELAKLATPDENGDFIFTGTNKVGFVIKDRLDNNATENTIKLEVILKGETFSAQVQPIFGTAGTSGSDYTLRLIWENNELALNLSEQKSLEYKNSSQQVQHTPANMPAISGKAYLYDQAFQIVDIKEENSHYEFSWYKTYEPNVTDSLIQASEILKYPVASDKLQSLLVDNGNNVFTDLSNAIPYLLTRDNGTQKYVYNLKEGFIEENTPLGIYYQTIGENANFDAIEFQEIPNVIGPDDDGYNFADNGKIVGTGNNRTYYYSGIRRAFVKYNDVFIIDPWSEYSEVETYYEPVKTKEKVYTSSHLTIVTDQDENNKGHVILYGNPSMECLYILEVRLADFGDYDLITRVPIALKSGEMVAASGDAIVTNGTVAAGQKLFVVDYIDGATDVRYATTGETDFDKNSYRITCRSYDTANHNFVTIRNGYPEENSLIGHWDICYEPQDDDEELHNFLPDLSYVENQCFLNPPGLYFKDTPLYGVQFKMQAVQPPQPNQNLCYPDTGSGLRSVALWTQPIYSYQDNYPSTTLNKWNGKDITTDDETGTIVANGFAAGKKERDNTFTGVVLGDWSRTDTDVYITQQTGVYGFNHGAMSYALKDDGTAFFGKDGRGRIYLSGNKAQIYSSEWVLSQEGMLLDIDNGYIKMIKKNATTSIPYFDAASFNTQVQLNTRIGNPMFYLQDYAPIKNGNTYWDRTGSNSLYIPSNFNTVDTGQDSQYQYVQQHYGYGAKDYLTQNLISDQSYFWYACVYEIKTTVFDQNNDSEQDTSYEVKMYQVSIANNTLTLSTSGSNKRACLVKTEHIYENAAEYTYYHDNNAIQIQNDDYSSVTSSSWQQQIIHIEKKTYYFLLDLQFSTTTNNNSVSITLNSNSSDVLFSDSDIGFTATSNSYNTDDVKVKYVRAVGYQAVSSQVVSSWPTVAKGLYFTPTTNINERIYVYDISREINYNNNNPSLVYDAVIQNMPLDISYYTENGSYASVDDVIGKYITLSVAEKRWPLSIGRNKSVGSRKFKVNWDGQLYAEDGVFSGKITSHEGEIGGWIIDQWMLYSKYQQKPTWEELGPTGWSGVVLDARGGNLYGAGIYTHKGRIGGWWIQQNNLYGGNTMLHRSNGIITDVIKIKTPSQNVDQFGDAQDWSYFGGMGYVNADFEANAPDETDLSGAGVGMFYGIYNAASSQAIYKVNGNNLGFKWFGPYMSINMRPPEGSQTPPPGNAEGAKYWRFGGNNQTAFYIQDMILFSVKLKDNDQNDNLQLELKTDNGISTGEFKMGSQGLFLTTESGKTPILLTVNKDSSSTSPTLALSSSETVLRKNKDVKLVLDANALLQRDDNNQLKLDGDVLLKTSETNKLSLKGSSVELYATSTNYLTMNSNVLLQVDGNNYLQMEGNVTLQQNGSNSLALNGNAVLKGGGATLTIDSKTTLTGASSVSITTGDFTLTSSSVTFTAPASAQQGIYARFA